ARLVFTLLDAGPRSRAVDACQKTDCKRGCASGFHATMTTRAALRAALARKKIIVAPGVWDGMTALLAKEAGFSACRVAGSAIAHMRFGRPDVGLVSMSEMADSVAAMRDRVDIALVVDADTGYGNALNVTRTV